MLRLFLCQKLQDYLALSVCVRLRVALFVEGNVIALDEFFHDRSPDKTGASVTEPTVTEKSL
jgi:hypothetical protein